MPEMIRYLEDQHAVVTGGSRGIGAAVAAELVRRGARVTIMGRSAETLEKQARDMRGEKGATVSTEECDVSSAESVANAFSRSVSTLGPVQFSSTMQARRRADSLRRRHARSGTS